MRIKGAKNLLHRRDNIPGVHPIEIYIVRPKTAQRSFKRSVKILATVTAGIRIAWLSAKSEFRRKHNLVASSTLSNELADHLFALAIGVAVSRIDEIPSCGEVLIEDGFRRSFIRAPSPLGPQRHRSQAKRADTQTGTTEGNLFISFHLRPSQVTIHPCQLNLDRNLY